MFSYPVTFHQSGDWVVVQDMELSDEMKVKIKDMSQVNTISRPRKKCFLSPPPQKRGCQKKLFCQNILSILSKLLHSKTTIFTEVLS